MLPKHTNSRPHKLSTILLRKPRLGWASLSSVPHKTPLQHSLPGPRHGPIWAWPPGREAARRTQSRGLTLAPEAFPTLFCRGPWAALRLGEGSRWGSDGRRHPPARQMVNKGAHKGGRGTRAVPIEVLTRSLKRKLRTRPSWRSGERAGHACLPAGAGTRQFSSF